MMLSEIFSQLSTGELNNLALAGEDGEIPKEKYERLVNHVNMGLVELHKRFLLRVGEVWVDLVPGQSQYVLKRLYQVGNREGRKLVQYIRESDPVFLDDIIKIEQVFDQSGTELGLNDPENLYSVVTPTMNTIRVPSDLVRDRNITSVRVQYRAKPEKIVWEDKFFDPSDTEVELSDVHLQALCYFIASRIHNPVGFSETVHEGNNYAAKFERECASLDAQNLRVDTSSTNTKPMRGGWV